MKKIVEAKYTSLRFDEHVLGNKEVGFECSRSAVSCEMETHLCSLLTNDQDLTEGQSLACKWQTVMTDTGEHAKLVESLYKVG
jgi:ethanolaminephosphotransferase